MHQFSIPAVAEARQRLIEELQQELTAKERQKRILAQEIRLLRADLKRQLRSAGTHDGPKAEQTGDDAE